VVDVVVLREGATSEFPPYTLDELGVDEVFDSRRAGSFKNVREAHQVAVHVQQVRVFGAQYRTPACAARCTTRWRALRGEQRLHAGRSARSSFTTRNPAASSSGQPGLLQRTS